MKKFIFLMIIAITTVQANAQFTKATLQATGLTCALCSNAVNKALQKVPFIASVKADIKNTAFNVVFKPGINIDVDAIKAAVEDAGFSVGSLKLTGDFNNLQVENDEHVKIGSANYHFLNVKNQVLNGEQTITVVDKNFVSSKAFKTIRSYTKKECVETGETASCCKGMIAPSRMYHVTI
ncbi:MAG: heavy-metal-associated domain-containing protein [Niabella sp.]